jgi:hypothetical protein
MWRLTVVVLILGSVMEALNFKRKGQTWKPLATFRYR